ncbi:hypothetical protein T02_1868 [Trichinella nativa]|uniref:Uncharacterized protein n=1 Tax=Trichinella nativa TaxID=6335 RepID=A0A0V1KQN7_9BILA|nr:hypothetical protein T02_12941 [Trichinella nativa]KRZ56906.1 hypothetical protein T02_1868 [Trichinella nativa]
MMGMLNSSLQEVQFDLLCFDRSSSHSSDESDIICRKSINNVLKQGVPRMDHSKRKVGQIWGTSPSESISPPNTPFSDSSIFSSVCSLVVSHAVSYITCASLRLLDCPFPSDDPSNTPSFTLSALIFLTDSPTFFSSSSMERCRLPLTVISSLSFPITLLE